MRHARILKLILLSLIFFALCTFFIQTEALLPYDGDDWRYLSQWRVPLPSSAQWNPSRVFPEVLQPVIGWIAAFLVTPLCGNYISAIQITASIIDAFSITVLCAFLAYFFHIVTHSHTTSFFCTAFFLTCAFAMFRTEAHHNTYLFYAPSLTLFCYYVMPNILNSILVLFLLSAQVNGLYQLQRRWYLIGGILLFIYLAQFSMTTASLISATCAGVLVLVRLYSRREPGIVRKLAACFRHPEPLDLLLYFLLGCWLVAALLDATGARFSYFEPSYHWEDALHGFRDLRAKLPHGIARMALGAIGIAAILTILQWRYAGKKNAATPCFIVLVAASLLWTFLAVWIAARTSGYSAARIDFMYGVFFYALLLTSLSIAYFLQLIPPLRCAAPFVLFLLLVSLTRGDRPWAGTQYESPRKITQLWIDEARRQDAAGTANITLRIPKSASWSQNWFGDVLANTLFAHGITTRRLRIIVENY